MSNSLNTGTWKAVGAYYIEADGKKIAHFGSTGDRNLAVVASNAHAENLGQLDDAKRAIRRAKQALLECCASEALAILQEYENDSSPRD